jgi:hypothetical protein
MVANQISNDSDVEKHHRRKKQSGTTRTSFVLRSPDINVLKSYLYCNVIDEINYCPQYLCEKLSIRQN